MKTSNSRPERCTAHSSRKQHTTGVSRTQTRQVSAAHHTAGDSSTPHGRRQQHTTRQVSAAHHTADINTTPPQANHPSSVSSTAERGDAHHHNQITRLLLSRAQSSGEMHTTTSKSPVSFCLEHSRARRCTPPQANHPSPSVSSTAERGDVHHHKQITQPSGEMYTTTSKSPVSFCPEFYVSGKL